MKQELYKPKPSKALEKCNELLSDIFVKYANKDDDMPENVSNKTDFTSFVFNVHNEKFVFNDETQKKAQEDVKKLCLLYREYSLYLEDTNYGNEEFIKLLEDCRNTVDKIINEIKTFFPEITIPYNLKNI